MSDIEFFGIDRIKEFEAERESRIVKIPITAIQGNIISGLEAEAILQKEFGPLLKWSIISLLGSIKSFKGKTPNEHGELIVNNRNVIARYELLFYLEDDVRGLILLPEYNLVPFEFLKKKNPWNSFDEQGLISFLKLKNQEQKLMVCCRDNFIPGHYETGNLIGMKQGIPDYQEEWVSDHYGEDAQKLIENQHAYFYLEDIIALEESHFKKEETKEPKKSSTKEIVKHLFEQEIEKIKKGDLPLPHNKRAMAQRIFNAGKQQAFYQDELDPKKRDAKIATIARILGDLKYKRQINALKQSLKHSN